MNGRRLYRSEQDKMLFGVSGGLAVWRITLTLTCRWYGLAGCCCASSVVKALDLGLVERRAGS